MKKEMKSKKRGRKEEILPIRKKQRTKTGWKTAIDNVEKEISSEKKKNIKKYENIGKSEKDIANFLGKVSQKVSEKKKKSYSDASANLGTLHKEIQNFKMECKIGFFGKTSVGKSHCMNYFLGKDITKSSFYNIGGVTQIPITVSKSKNYEVIIEYVGKEVYEKRLNHLELKSSFEIPKNSVKYKKSKEQFDFVQVVEELQKEIKISEKVAIKQIILKLPNEYLEKNNVSFTDIMGHDENREIQNDGQKIDLKKLWSLYTETIIEEMDILFLFSTVSRCEYESIYGDLFLLNDLKLFKENRLPPKFIITHGKDLSNLKINHFKTDEELLEATKERNLLGYFCKAFNQKFEGIKVEQKQVSKDPIFISSQNFDEMVRNVRVLLVMEENDKYSSKDWLSLFIKERNLQILKRKISIFERDYQNFYSGLYVMVTSYMPKMFVKKLEAKANHQQLKKIKNLSLESNDPEELKNQITSHLDDLEKKWKEILKEDICEIKKRIEDFSKGKKNKKQKKSRTIKKKTSKDPKKLVNLKNNLTLLEEVYERVSILKGHFLGKLILKKKRKEVLKFYTEEVKNFNPIAIEESVTFDPETNPEILNQLFSVCKKFKKYIRFNEFAVDKIQENNNEQVEKKIGDPFPPPFKHSKNGTLTIPNDKSSTIKELTRKNYLAKNDASRKENFEKNYKIAPTKLRVIIKKNESGDISFIVKKGGVLELHISGENEKFINDWNNNCFFVEKERYLFPILILEKYHTIQKIKEYVTLLNELSSNNQLYYLIIILTENSIEKFKEIPKAEKNSLILNVFIKKEGFKKNWGFNYNQLRSFSILISKTLNLSFNYLLSNELSSIKEYISLSWVSQKYSFVRALLFFKEVMVDELINFNEKNIDEFLKNEGQFEKDLSIEKKVRRVFGSAKFKKEITRFYPHNHRVEGEISHNPKILIENKLLLILLKKKNQKMFEYLSQYFELKLEHVNDVSLYEFNAKTKRNMLSYYKKLNGNYLNPETHVVSKIRSSIFLINNFPESTVLLVSDEGLFKKQNPISSTFESDRISATNCLFEGLGGAMVYYFRGDYK